ncbi:MAG: sensor protein [Phycisphaerales bacterium]|nr:sensor protein [Phycisphaerales bacterium]
MAYQMRGLRRFAMVLLAAGFSIAADADPHAHMAMHASDGADTSLAGQYDFFTNFGSYLAKTHCLRTADGQPDWPWIGILIALNLTVMVGYLKIFVFWRKCYVSEAPADRNSKLMDLAGIFLLCAMCGYGFFVITIFWPAYRLLAVFMVALSIFTWRFAADLGEFRFAFSAKRSHRELQESLVRRNDELETLVANRTAQLERADRFKGEFLANMSHELRTPMTAILGFADLLADPATHNGEQAVYVETIRRNGHHLLGLLNDVLDVSKIEAGKLNVERVACSVGDEVRQVVGSLRPKADALGLTLAVDVSPDVPALVLTDPLRVRQIVTNLVANAIKFTKTGGVTVTVAVQARTGRTPQLRIIVRDTGRGIGPNELDGIFDRFGQTGTRGRAAGSGSGLGLTISRSLARLLGGDIVAQSTPGVGSVFTVSLDAGDTSLAAAPSDDARPATADRHTLAGVHVLIAEDVPDSRAFLRTLLKRWGATTEVAENGRTAVEAGVGGAFDLVLMDIEMPEMDGLTATQQLRQNGYAGPIVALTANALIGDRAACMSAGCTEYASKPLDAAKLIETIRRAMIAAPAKTA